MNGNYINKQEAIVRLARDNSILIFFVIASIFSACFVPNFSTIYNVKNFLLQASDLLIIACGLTFVVLNGGIDFSVTSVLALGSVISAYIMAISPLAPYPMLSIPIAIISTVAIGILIGMINGVAITKLKMPSFMVTLATQLGFSGLAILFANVVATRASINGLPDEFFVLGGEGDFYYVPIVIALIVFAISHFILEYTGFGRKILSVGTNPKTSFISGMPVKKTILMLFVLCGAYAALAALIATSRNQAGIASLGDKMFISIIASIVIGGTSVAGGSGGFKQTLSGVLLITLINNTMNLLGVQWYITMLFQGVLILIAAFTDYLLRARRGMRRV